VAITLGDSSTLAGATANLGTTNVNVTGSVYGHASGSLSTNSVTLAYVHAGYSNAVITNVGVNNSAGFRVNLQTAATNSSNNVSVGSVSGVSNNASANATVTLAIGQGVGAFTNSIGVVYGDNSTLAGANSAVGTNTLTVSGLVYSGQSTWTNTGSGNWTSFANWNLNGGTPGLDGALSVNDTATFGAAGSGSVTLNTNASLSALTFSNAGSAYTLNGTGTITLQAGSNQPVISDLSGNHTISNAMAFGTNVTITNASSSSLTMGGSISGSGGFSQTGAGTVTLWGANSYTGSTLISGGVLNIQNNSALGGTNAGTTVGDGAALQLQGGITVTGEALTLGGVGVNLDGALRNISGTNTYAGVITLSAISTNRVFIFSDAGLLTLNTGTITGSGISSLRIGGNGNMAISSVIGIGTGGLTKGGTGTLTLSGSNTYSGGSVLNAGTTIIGNANALGSNTNTLSNNATLDLAGFSITQGSLAGSGVVTNGTAGNATLTLGGNNNSTTFSGSLLAGTGTISLVKNGAGTLTLTASNSYSGGTTVSAGTVAFTGGSSLGSGGVSLSSGSSLIYGGSGAATLNNNITVGSGTGIIGNTSGSLLTLGGTLTKSGSILEFYGGSYNVTSRITGSAPNSDLLLSNADVTLSYSGNDYNGPTKLFAGSTLTANVANVLPSTSILTVGGAGESSSLTNSFNLNGYSQTLGGLYSGTGAYNQLLNSAGTAAMLTLAGNSLFGGSINGNLGLTLANATVTLSGNNSYSGGTVLNNSSLSLGNSGFLSGTTNVTVGSGSTFLLGGNNQVSTNSALTLNGGKLSMGAAAPGNRAPAQKFASLTLTANSVIDFANLSGTSSLTFGSIGGLSSNHTLSIYNWNGTTIWGTTSETGGAGQYTHLYDLSSLSSTELSYISFYSGTGTGFLGTGTFSGNEIVPVPEPGVIVTALLLLGGLLFSQRRRFTLS